MLRNRLTLAVCAAALIGSPALPVWAQEAPPVDPPAGEGDHQQHMGPPTAPAQPAQPAQPAEPDEGEAAVPAQPAEPAQPAPAAVTADGDVLAVLRARGGFDTFLQAMDAAGLTAVVEADPDITLFAPTDAAFAALPEGELERLMDEANRDELRQLLLFHVINADVRSEQLVNRRGEVETGSGEQVMIDGGGEQIRFGEATVTEADVRGANGAVFVIDRLALAVPAAPAEAADEAPASPMPTQPTDVPAQDAPTAPPAPATPPVETPDVIDAEETTPDL